MKQVNFKHPSCGIVMSDAFFQVSNAVDLSNLIQRLQDERIAVALNIFLQRRPDDDLKDLQKYIINDINIVRFTLLEVLPI